MLRTVKVHEYKVPVIYITPRCSCTWWAVWIINITIFILPLLISFSSNNFWKSYEVVLASPQVVSTGKAFVRLLSTDSEIAWGTESTHYNRYITNFSPALYTSDAVDKNLDETMDELHISIAIPTSKRIHVVQLLLEVEYTVGKGTNFFIRAAPILQFETPISASSISFISSLELHQKVPMKPSSQPAALNANSFITSTDPWSLEDFSAQENARNDTLKMILDSPPLWDYSFRDEFLISGVVKIPSHQPVTVVPGITDNYRWGWAQYLSLLLPMYWLGQILKDFVFNSRLLSARAIQPPYMKCVQL